RVRRRLGPAGRRGAGRGQRARAGADKPRAHPAVRRPRRAGRGPAGAGEPRMIELTIAHIADIVGGQLADISPEAAAATRITGTVEFDSRAVTTGGLFLALPGARADGHDF